MGRMLDTAIEHGCSVILLPGDVFAYVRPGAAAIRSFVRFCRRAARAGITIRYTPGNHDGAGELHDVSSKTAAWLAEARLAGLRAYPAPTVDLLDAGGEQYALVALPYPHKRAVEREYPDRTPEERTAIVGGQIENLIGDLWERARNEYGLPVLFMGHLSVLGAMAGSEQLLKMGWDAVVGSYTFDRFAYAALGHLHLQQRVSATAWYSGSPEYMSFGEEGHEKGWLLVDVSAGLPTVTSIPSGARPLVTITPTDDDWPAVVERVPEGAIVRVRAALSTATSREFQKALRARATWVQMEPPPRTEQPVRARVQLSSGTSVLDLTGQYLVHRGLPAEPYMSAARTLLAEEEGRRGDEEDLERG